MPRVRERTPRPRIESSSPVPGVQSGQRLSDTQIGEEGSGRGSKARPEAECKGPGGISPPPPGEERPRGEINNRAFLRSGGNRDVFRVTLQARYLR